MTTISARQFNQDVGGAKRAAARGPVVITDRGEPAFVLMTIDDYRRHELTGAALIDVLTSDVPTAVEIEPLPADMGFREFEL